MYQTWVMADCTLVAQEASKEDQEQGIGWNVMCHDTLSGKSVQSKMTCTELGAISALAHGIGEDGLLSEDAVREFSREGQEKKEK